MEYRRLGRSGLMVPALSLGTGTFGGVGKLAAWGSTDATEARRLVDICLDALPPGQVAALDAASDVLPPYQHRPYRQQEGFTRLNPALV